MTDSTDTIPPQIVHTAAEDRWRTFDATAELATAETVTAPVLVLRDRAGVVVAMQDAPIAAGKTILWRIRAGVLTAASDPYYLRFLYTPSGTTNVLESRLKIICPS